MALYTYLFLFGVILVIIGALTSMFDYFGWLDGKLSDLLLCGGIILWIVAGIWRNFSKYPPLTFEDFLVSHLPVLLFAGYGIYLCGSWIHSALNKKENNE